MNPKIKISTNMKDLLISLLEMNPDKRISWESFFSHSIFKKYNNEDLLVKENFSRVIFENRFNEENFKDKNKNLELYSEREISEPKDIFSYLKKANKDANIQESHFMSIRNTPKIKDKNTFTPSKKSSFGNISTNKFSNDSYGFFNDEDRKTQKRPNEKKILTEDEYFSNREGINRHISPFSKNPKMKDYSVGKKSRAEIFRNQLLEAEGRGQRKSKFN